jgi:hypothetical protein
MNISSNASEVNIFGPISRPESRAEMHVVNSGIGIIALIGTQYAELLELPALEVLRAQTADDPSV